jgi:hypothetical protein
LWLTQHQSSPAFKARDIHTPVSTLIGFRYRGLPTMAHEHDLEEAHGPDGRYLPKECIVCHEDTQLRCGGCRQPICHLHASCPNGCDDLGVAELAAQRR